MATLSQALSQSGLIAAALDSLNLTIQTHLASEIPEQVHQLQDGDISPCFTVQGWDSQDAVWLTFNLYDANLTGGSYYVLECLAGHDAVPDHFILK